ncbi:MAG: sigma-54-dependent Fis family transcriptional regulator [Candidatus Binataceae bacterium]|nr:sigma-54-dependent Fis family transcriptional regulator [Candidatus Binataceae bacterium]
MGRILIVDDEKNIRAHLATFLETLGHLVIGAESGAQALDRLSREEPFDLVLTDYRMAEMNGLELLQKIKQQTPDTVVILMTAFATVENAVAVMKAGAFDYLSKPFSLEQIEQVISRAMEVRSLRAENRSLRDTIEGRPLLDTNSATMRLLLDTARQAAGSDATALLVGESGTGKNVLAHQIHRWSRRADKPFVEINCTTLSEHLLESELFGHTRGAFTGALKDKPGRLEAADHGTVFLDEIADLTPPLQAKFLRFVQAQSFERIGGDRTIEVDVRIIAASNRDLGAEVASHRFREDLFYRLNVIALHVPALRERPQDVLPLAQRLLTAAAIRNRRPPLSFAPETAVVLQRHRWPGNVRELRNAIERAVVLSRSEIITPEYLPDGLFVDHSTTPEPAEPTSLEELEREHIVRVLAQSPTLEDAAATLGIDVSTLWRKRKRYRID